ncbi:Uu.00g055050.m01.CDS01 [Anthostomella pinea]|uniref:Uu.00g055050.m01.CDS01 n=1 Tax=Anthostomella pinea TaxID=933095 RepID=A0AAI8VXD6_9PEZI|nr:Uu.00g055050.m01.CDS01 [Anthostomella pinea]
MTSNADQQRGAFDMESFYEMLGDDKITYELLGALFKRNRLVFATTYGSEDQPRVFKIEMIEKHANSSTGKCFRIWGKYFDHDGKKFSYKTISHEIAQFSGPRKITSLGCYPLKLHKEEVQLRKYLIKRGKKFVELSSVTGGRFVSHHGMAYLKLNDSSVLKINVNGRIMVDPAGHRRINPNYPRDYQGPDPFDWNEYKIDSDEEDSDDSRGLVTSWWCTDEQYLITSPVVMGFAFCGKKWLEFTVSDIKDITWNGSAYDDLVMQARNKELVEALIRSHNDHAAERMDDIIAGKGRGLVFVLHGPPGTGKTLTAEAISDAMKCPLYKVSAAELGTDPRGLEAELQKIMDICHGWGAIMLLDEVDAFLSGQIFRDAFLRTLEYFEGILFLTTNRIENLDSAILSRCFIPLRYNQPDRRERTDVFKTFIDRVRRVTKVDEDTFTEEALWQLGWHRINGRQIRNTVSAAHALAAGKGERLSMDHINHVLGVQQSDIEWVSNPEAL